MCTYAFGFTISFRQQQWTSFRTIWMIMMSSYSPMLYVHRSLLNDFFFWNMRFKYETHNLGNQAWKPQSKAHVQKRPVQKYQLLVGWSWSIDQRRQTNAICVGTIHASSIWKIDWTGIFIEEHLRREYRRGSVSIWYHSIRRFYLVYNNCAKLAVWCLRNATPLDCYSTMV